MVIIQDLAQPIAAFAPWVTNAYLLIQILCLAPLGNMPLRDLPFALIVLLAHSVLVLRYPPLTPVQVVTSHQA